MEKARTGWMGGGKGDVLIDKAVDATCKQTTRKVNFDTADCFLYSFC